MTHQLGIKYTEFNPRDYWFYGLNASLVDYWNHKRNLGEFFCRTYDTVVVGDTITDSRFLLQWIDEISVSKAAATAQETGTRLCKIKKILMMTTNRFDFAIKKDDLPDYHNLLKRVTRLGDQPGRKFPKIIWMANNPFDIQYVKVALGDWVKFKLIRSFGYSTLPAVQLLPKHVTELPAVYNHYDESRFIGWLKRNDIEVSVLKRNYGGPTSLSQFRAFIDFPYQASTMKMYENLLYGVVTLAPSKRLFVNDLEGYIIEGDRVPGWQDYVEYWYDDMKDYVYIFDTIEELREILKKPEIDTRGIRERGESIWKELNKQSLSSWSKVLKQ
ncbi:hypothetical protein BDR26DRAFT_856334 [Obelidium mucronatum]|nr:hypothetical protein BDR26DRAFT_856334 [Obelidium mucronatum]